MFVFYGAIFSFPQDASSLDKVAYMAENQVTLFIMNIIGYVLFGFLLAILVLAIHRKLIATNETLVQLASIFGLIWVGIIITGGMMANIGLQTLIDLANTEPEHVRAVWLANNVVEESLGGGIEIFGGLWVLLITIVSLKGKLMPFGLNILGLIVGVAGILTLYPLDLFTEIFGLTQIVWFIWLGIVLIRDNK
ncbi:DUF4386 family protein [Aliikangiella marina]|uniref:DUF4386 family protein n=2 Tax=Aliikangiella marina TaxID=1712262 RepID=A0A545TK14_9GAMM|nr:DUF4386 family protein [Aliikangiella marina]